MRPIEAQTLFFAAWSEPNRLSDSSWRVCAHALNFHCLQVTISYQTKKSQNMIIGQQSNNYLIKSSSLPRGFNVRSLVDCKWWPSKFGRLQVVCNWPLSYTFGNSGRKRHMSRKESPFAVNNNLLNMKQILIQKSHEALLIAVHVVFTVVFWSRFVVNEDVKYVDCCVISSVRFVYWMESR